MPVDPTDTAMLTADAAISRLAERLDHSPSGRLSAGPRGSAEVCFRDAETCFGRGDYVHALERAERGLLYADEALELEARARRANDRIAEELETPAFAAALDAAAELVDEPPAVGDVVSNGLAGERRRVHATDSADAFPTGMLLLGPEEGTDHPLGSTDLVWHRSENWTVVERGGPLEALRADADRENAPESRPAGRGPSVPEGWTLDDDGIAHPPSRTLPERAFVERALDVMSDPADGSEPELERLRRLPDTAPLGDDPFATDSALARLELVQRELTDVCRDRDELLDRVSSYVGELARRNGEIGRLRAELERAYLGDFPPPVPTEGA